MVQTFPSTSYQIHLSQFEGPFDLLLFFIERDELDIRDIPISKITQDFLAYIHHMEKLEMEVASEFILMASTLINIKAKMLIPRPQINQQGEEMDPRQELVEQLLAYKQAKQGVEKLEELEKQAEFILSRAYASEESKVFENQTQPEDELQGLSLYKILQTYKKIIEMQKMKIAKPTHVIQPYPYKIEDVKEELLQSLQKIPKIDFLSYVERKPERIYVIFGILSILELTQMRKIQLIFGEGFNNFWMMLANESNAS